MVGEEKLKLGELDSQIVNLLEERLEIYWRLKSSGQEIEKVEFSNKNLTPFFNLIFKEFEKKADKYKVKNIVASGPVIIEEGKLLVNKDSKDDFYKLPGGTVEPDTEDLEEACLRETKEEINGEVEIIRPLHPMIIWKNPQTDEKMAILLIHYLSKLKNKEEIKPILPVKEVRWLDVEEIRRGKHDVAPNIKFLLEKGDLE